MTEQSVKQQLAKRIQGDVIMIDDFGQWIPVSDFVSRFASAADLSYAALKAVAEPGTGWPETFDAWHSEGLI